jgi:Tfp pilus assembly protein PilV
VRSSDPDKRSCPARLRARCAAAYAAGRSRLRAERGSALIEVLVGCVVLAVATAGILNGIDGAQGVAAKNKARSVQATLAQQDIERMRSMPVSSLDNFTQTRTLNVAGADYTVVSRTDWVSDKAGVVNCSNTSAKAEYLKLTSTVTSAATGAKTVTETGLLTPAAGALSTSTGSATVQLTGRNGLPVPSGVTVNLTGASSQTATTNSLGCAVFGFIPVGSYNITIPGRVAMESISPATSTMQVYTGRATFTALQVDIPATLRAIFVPPVGQTITTSMVWDTITVKNANLIGGKKTFTNTAGRSTSVDAPNLYPFLDGVGVYAGNCAANDPSLYSTNYFNPSATRGWTALLPGDALRSVNVEMPTLRVTVNRQAVTPSAAGATTAQVPSWTRTQLMVTQNDGTGCNSVIHTLTNTRTASTTAVLFPIAQPFGHYTVCASTRGQTNTSTSGTAIVDRKITTTVNLTSPIPATPNRAITMTTTAATSGVCF